jgi:Carboxypeptidase regulatory-like domain/TonB dependent receptor
MRPGTVYTFVVIAISLFAQSETAVLTGRVTDPGGLGVTSAQVRLTDNSTGAARTASTIPGGFYRFDLLPPGDYSISVTVAGFKTFQDSKIHLEVARVSSLDIPLTLGAVTESVQVDATVSPLVTTSAAQGTVISSEEVKAIPLNGRQFLQLALLSPGTNSGGLAVQQNSLRQGEIGGLSVAGQRTNDSAYLLDGVMNTDPDYNALSYVPILDAIAEFQVQIAQYSAEYGRASGGQINVLTSSGGKQWHGAAWEFLRNNVLDARPFNLTTQSNVPEFRRNQFGGAIGGPLLKDKVFGFFSYEGLRNRQAAANLTTVAVPDLLQRAGNFSEELPKVVIYDPTIPLVNGQRTPFTGNIISPGKLNAQVLAAMAALPTPNVPGGLFINTTDVLRQDSDNLSARVDYSLSERLRMFTRYSAADETAASPATLPNRDGLDNAVPRNAAFGFSQVISANKVNDIRLGFSRLNFLYGLPEPSFQVNGNATALPNFIAGQLNFGGAGPYNATGPGGIAQARDNTYQAWDIFAWQLGRHSLKLGGEFDAFQYVRFEYADPLGSLTFTSGYTNATAAAPKAGDVSGDALASALLGYPQTSVRTLGPNRIDGRQKNYGLFIQDDFRVTARLTVNAGVRYEVSPPLDDIRHQLASIDFSTAPTPIEIFAAGKQGVYSPTLFVCGRDGYPDGCARTRWTNFSPRAGFAFSLNDRTVIRAGAGLYYGTQDGNTLLKLAQSLPTTYNQTLTSPSAYVPSSTISNVFSPAIVGSASIQAAAIDPNQKTPYSPQWSFTIQRSLLQNLVLEAGYLGTGGVDLEQNVQVNNGMPGPTAKRPYFGLQLAPAVQSALAFPYTATTVPVTTINYFPHSAHSNYHALLVRAERKYSSGFSLLSSFTYSKALTNAPQYRNAGGMTGDENSPPQNSFNLAADRGPAYFNTKFRWVTSSIYSLPFGKGGKIFTDGVPAAILGGWQLTGTLQLQSGFPYTINYKGDPINIGGGSGGILVRPNYVLDASGHNVDPNLPSDQRSTARYFNTAAFVQPVLSFGDVSRGSMTGASLVNLDATISRTLRLADRASLQFRAEFFNLANHPNYNLIGRIVNDPTFGIVQNQLPPRQIQFAMKLSF